MQLLPDQRRALIDDGYLIIPGAVPPERVNRALRAINLSLGQHGLPPDRLPEMRAQTFCPDLIEQPELVELFSQTTVGSVARAAIGQVVVPTRAQIALRFPGPQGGAAVPHVDGMYSPDNGVAPDSLYHFTALAGVFLNDIQADDRGNLTVWPGSHRGMAQHFAAHGPQTLLQGFPAIAMPAPRQLQVRAGDAVLAHYLLAHGVAPNRGPHVRYAAFFRLFHANHAALGTRPMVEPWLEWPGVRDPDVTAQAKTPAR